MLEVPADGLVESAVECAPRRPSELAPGLGGVDRVTPVVPAAVFDVRLQLGVSPAPRAAHRVVAGCRMKGLECRADPVNEIEVGDLVPAAQVVPLADTSGRQDG